MGSSNLATDQATATMSKLNSKMYKKKMLEENKKSSENISVVYLDHVQVGVILTLNLQQILQENPSGSGIEDCREEKLSAGCSRFWRSA